MQTKPVTLAEITVSHNPRCPSLVLRAALEAEGHPGKTFLNLVHELALSSDPAKKAEYCRLMEKYEGEEIADGIVQLAISRAHMELQPIVLRDFRVKKTGDTPLAEGESEYLVRYGVVAGERRILACAYNHAKHGANPELSATVKKLTVDAAFNLAVEENLRRRQPNDMEYGRLFHNYREEINPDTGKNWILKDVARKLKLDYQFVRCREALVYLPETDQQKIETGSANITLAIKKGLALKNGKPSVIPVNAALNRQRVMSLRQVQELFDKKSTEKNSDATKTAYLQALATVMNISYAVACKESEKRIETEEVQHAQKELRASRKVG